MKVIIKKKRIASNTQRVQQKQYSKISRDKRDEMFIVFCDKRSVGEVMRKCHIHRKTANRYRKIDAWDSRLDAAEREAVRQTHKKMVNRTKRNLEALDIGIDASAKAIKDADYADPKHLHNMVKVQQSILYNNPDKDQTEEINEEVQQALRTLNQFEPEQMKAIGDHIVDLMVGEKETVQ